MALASPRMMSQQRPSTAPARASSDGEPLAEGCRILCLLIAALHKLPISMASALMCPILRSSSGQAAVWLLSSCM